MKTKSLSLKIQKTNTDLKIKILERFFDKPERILDFGCGDLSLAKALLRFNPRLKLWGIDVVDFGIRSKRIVFKKYDGVSIPFRQKTFNTVLAYQVFHHCKDTQKALQECARVAKNRLIINEPVYRHPLELPFMKFMDWFWNVWKRKSISLPYKFYSVKEWHVMFIKKNLTLVYEKNVDRFLPNWIPIGRTYLFVVKK